MKSKYHLLLLCSLLSLSVSAQKISGTVNDASNGKPISNVSVSIDNGRFKTKTDNNGKYSIKTTAGNKLIEFQHPQYLTATQSVSLEKGSEIDIQTALNYDIESEMKNEVMQMLQDLDLNDEDGSSQNVSSILLSNGDIFSSTASYSFSTARFRLRGYGYPYESTYINGINFNDQERGRFSYSSLGGLNDASRNKEINGPLEASDFSYGNIGNSSNINMWASEYAAGGKVGIAATNRSYWLRASATYATGLMQNGWAFAASAAYRWSQEGRTEGTFYNSGAYFFSAEKVFNPHHRINMLTYGAPTQRANSSALTQETIDLTSIYYNPYWGYYNGKKRNSRIVNSFDPTAIFNYEWKINREQKWTTGFAIHYNMYNSSALTFFNAPDPRPDYYRNLPSYLLDGHFYYGVNSSGEKGFFADKNATNIPAYYALTDLWKSRNSKTTQIDWDALYQANAANNILNPNGNAKYMIEKRHNNSFESMLNSLYSHQANEHLKINVGLEAKITKGIHYKTIGDLMGANQAIDIDPFADRDIADLAENITMSAAEISNVRQNDVDNPDKILKKGDKFGYHYNINIYRAAVFAQNEWDFNKLKFHYALKLNYTNFSRFGYMRNGRAEYTSRISGEPVISKGQGSYYNFVDPSFKAGINYSFSGSNRLSASFQAETRAPLPDQYYISPRISDRTVNIFDYNRGNSLANFYGLSEKIIAYELSYMLNMPIVRARISLFRTHSIGGIERVSYYNDEYRTFINVAMLDVNKIYQGVEFGVSVKLGTMFKLSGVLGYTDAHYTDNAIGIESTENGMYLEENKSEIKDRILTKGLKVGSGPQLNANLKLNFFHSSMWFAELSASYFDFNYMNIAPSRLSQGIMTGTRADGTKVSMYYNNEQKAILGTQESLVDPLWYNRIIIDASVGKLIYFKGGKSLNINLSLSNITNNTHLKTGGYQQPRVPTVTYRGTSYVSNNVNKFPSKYYYAWGFNFFLNVGFRF